ncbi:mechanosensitive ion channel family protein [Amnibacterium kyonggiense]|uniref:Small-conductance mechanosensitive channel n=1 Tax=Amnibacterium kyonggiense TaxID=595671 RepID=A0A4R7FJC3_9MICO|nr:mechanosensitive ion channel family protein [Amnibacterium kyonggiense]TDS76175.1 small-conductance mechanosensitive channel [Amnibacterium kyonggiense]
MDLASVWADVVGHFWSRLGADVVVGAVIAVVVAGVVGAVFRAIGRRRGWPDRAVHRLRWPFRWLLVAIAVWIAATSAFDGAGSDVLQLRTPIDAVLNIVVIALAAWFVATIVSLVVDLLLARYRTDVADNRVARRVRTQALIIRRVAIVVIVVIALASALLVFPAARAAGASLLASAGVVSIIAGLAAQSTLGNVIAGMQLAFSGAIRVDDVVIANGEWGRIEEITLTYVVVHVWDDRRMVLPSTYFTTTPFENWTRTSSQLMQSVDFDLDWLVDPQAMRDEMHRVLERTDLWDGRVAVLQVTDAVGGMIHVRILVTAVDAPTLFDLRCFVREELIRWLHQQQPAALPRTRVQLTEPAVGTSTRTPRGGEQRDDRELFGGSAQADARGKDFTGPVRTHPA